MTYVRSHNFTDCSDTACRDCWDNDWRRAVGAGDDDRQAELEAEGRDHGWIF